MRGCQATLPSQIAKLLVLVRHSRVATMQNSSRLTTSPAQGILCTDKHERYYDNTSFGRIKPLAATKKLQGRYARAGAQTHCGCGSVFAGVFPARGIGCVGANHPDHASHLQRERE